MASNCTLVFCAFFASLIQSPNHFATAHSLRAAGRGAAVQALVAVAVADHEGAAALRLASLAQDCGSHEHPEVDPQLRHL